MKLSWRQKEDIITLKKFGFSSRYIAKKVLGREGRKSTVNDFLRSIDNLEIEEKFPKVLFIDIETSPLMAYVWGRYKQNIYQPMMISETYILTYSAKWMHKEDIIFGYVSKEDVKDENDYNVVKDLRDLIEEADIVIGHNLDEFDIKVIKTRMVYHNMPPVSPFKTIDTLKIVKNNFRCSSNKLNDVCEYFGIGSKREDGGFPTWKGYMSGDEVAMNTMIEYNIGDVDLLIKLYEKIKSYHKSHPNVQLYYDNSYDIMCPCCGSDDFVKTTKYVYTNISKFEAYQCNNCGKWFRGRKSINEDKEHIILGV